jgi:peptidyl-prolyl cis-trans isomerase C
MKRHLNRVLLIVVTLLMPMTALAQAPAQPAQDVNPAVIEVNGQKIHAAEISMAMRNIVAQMGGQPNPENEQAIMQMATQRMIEQTLLAQEAKRTKVKANEERLAEMVRTVEQQAGGRESLESSLASIGMTHDQLVNSLRDIELSRSLIETQISPTIQVSDEEVQTFYKENPEMFDAEAQVRARHIIFNCPLTADAQTNTETRARAEEARQRAVAGEDFAELARELSEGPTAPNGGDLGFFTHGQTAPQFANASFALQPGEISPVVRTEFGYHVIKVEERRPARRIPLDEASDHLKNLLIQQKTGETVGQLVEALADRAKIVNLVDGTDMVPGANQQVPQ